MRDSSADIVDGSHSRSRQVFLMWPLASASNLGYAAAARLIRTVGDGDAPIRPAP